MTDALRPIIDAYAAGHAALLVEERSLYDLVADEEGRVRPALEVLRRTARRDHGMHLVTYSMAQGLDWDEVRIEDRRDRDRVEQVLRLHGLLDVPQDQNEIVRVLRGIASMARSPRGTLQWADATEMRFGFLLEFAEHLAPGSLSNGTQTDLQMVAIELAHILGQSLALRGSGNLVLFHGRYALVDPLVTRALHRVRFRHPNQDEKRAFVDAVARIYPEARYDEGLTPEVVAHMTTNTPNRTLEQLVRASHRTGHRLSANQLTAQKSEDVVALSEESLSVLDPGRVAGVKLIGRNAERPAQVLATLGGLLRQGDSRMPANVLLAGAPGTGKTDLAVLTANAANVTAYQLHSPKRGIVGETERVSRLQHDLLKHWTPNVAFVDEITESLPLQRSEFDGDSGASRAVMAALLTTLSDESRRGRSLLVATTNCPWRMSDAMRGRFVFVPVLQPLVEDLPALIVATALRVQQDLVLDPTHPAIEEAARVFYGKGANPRHIRAALSHAAMGQGSLTPEVVLSAAEDLKALTDRVSAEYADLWAIHCCASRRFLPWADAPAEYPYPEYLEGLVDRASGDVDAAALARRLKELKPHANV